MMRCGETAKSLRNANIRAYLSTLQNASDVELCKVFGTKSVSLEQLEAL